VMVVQPLENVPPSRKLTANHDLHPFKLPIDIANVRFFQHSNIIWLVKSFSLGNIFSHINYKS
jgi:hypothetical protein